MSNELRKELADYWDGDGGYADFGGIDRDDAVDRFLSRNIVIPRSELPEVVTVEGNMVRANGGLYYTTGTWAGSTHWREKAMTYLAIAGHLESDAAQEAEKTAARDKCRDELAREFVNDGAYAYRFADEPLTLAIDRIIELEAAK